MRHMLLPLLTLAMPMAAVAEPQRYALDPDHTTIAFLVDHVGYARTLGLFAEVEGGFVYDAETRELGEVRVTVATASVETLNAARDRHVRSDDFLAADAYPAMVFTADGGTPESATQGRIDGTLALRGETHPLTLHVTLNKAEVYPFGHGRFTLGLSLEGSLSRSDWGMSYGVGNGLVGDEVTLLIETEAMRVED